MPFVGEHHGTSGPIHTSFNPFKLDIEDDLVKAADQLTGYAKKPMDPWSGDHLGFYHTLATIQRTGEHKGKRSYAARGYYEANAHRQNLKVVTRALVTKIVLDQDKATGVAFRCQGQDFVVGAKREVIVCGGAVNSPQILELSGIGNPEILRAASIEPKIENIAVGENLQDHVVTAIGYETAPGVATLDSVANPEVLQAAVKAMMEEQSGPLTCTATVQGFLPFQLFASEDEQTAIIKSIEQTPNQTGYNKKQRATVTTHLDDDKSANLQFLVVAATLNYEEGTADHSRLIPPPTDPTAPNQLALAIALQYSASRGHVHVKSSDPEQHPELNPGYLTHKSDLDVLAAGMKFLDAVGKAPALEGKLGKRVHPAPSRDLNNPEDRRQAVLDWYMGEYHLCGSVAMGDALDSRLKVKGTKNVRVADASAFPGQVSGNIQSSVYMLAEKAADIIKEDWDLAPLKGF